MPITATSSTAGWSKGIPSISPGVDVVSTTDDEIFLPVNDVEEAAFINTADIAGREPAVNDGRRGRLGQIPISLHDVVPSDLDLPWGSRRHLKAGLVDRAHLDASELANRAAASRSSG
jgi:hypothetical protein